MRTIRYLAAFSSLLLLSCNYPGNSAQGSFALQIEWPQPGFQLQVIPQETETIQLRIQGRQGDEVNTQISRDDEKNEHRFILDVGPKDIFVLALDAEGQLVAESESQVVILPNQVVRADIELSEVELILEPQDPSDGSGGGGGSPGNSTPSKPPGIEQNPSPPNRPNGPIANRIRELAAESDALKTLLENARQLPDGQIRLADGRIVNESQLGSLVKNQIQKAPNPPQLSPISKINGGFGGGGSSGAGSTGIAGVLSLDQLNASSSQINPGFVVRLRADITDVNGVLEPQVYKWKCQGLTAQSCPAPVASASDPKIAYWTAPDDAEGNYLLSLRLETPAVTIGPVSLSVEVSTGTQSVSTGTGDINGGGQ